MTLDALVDGVHAWFTAALPDHGIYALIAFAFIAGLARGFSGFGAALIFVPLGGAIVGPKLISPILLVIDGIASLGMIPPAWRGANRPEVFVMAAGAALGIPAGTAILTLLDPLLLRWSITIIAICLLALLVSGWRYHGEASAPLTSGVGLIAGLFSGAAQLGGPPVVAYWLGGKSISPASGRMWCSISRFRPSSAPSAIISADCSCLPSSRSPPSFCRVMRSGSMAAPNCSGLPKNGPSASPATS
jgi:hypothetical protein